MICRLSVSGLQQVMDALVTSGHQVIGPTVQQGAVVLDDICSVEQLPRGVRDAQQAGTYRLQYTDAPHLFAFNLGADSWKRWLFPSRSLLVELGPDLIASSAPQTVPSPMAFIGVRGCDLAAIEIQADVFGGADDRYSKRLQSTFIVGVHCQTAAATCFCASMDAGPAIQDSDYLDLLLTEILEADEPVFLAEAKSAQGRALLESVATTPAQDHDQGLIDAQLRETAEQISKQLPQSTPALLADNPHAEHWQDVAQRCLACGNCTAVCPTCFCSDVQEVTKVDANTTQRWQVWDSCFNASHSYTHSGVTRQSIAARYRQWLTHKLSSWHEQFGTSGCVGCGRCVTWCPVGIDLTEEVAAIAQEANGVS